MKHFANDLGYGYSSAENALQVKAGRLIAGGARSFVNEPKSPVEGWPTHYRWAKGIDLIDVLDRRFSDFTTMNMGACILGYADADVDAAVHHAIDTAAACSVNSPEEVMLAEKLIELHPWAEQVQFSRSGGEAMAAAVRVARAFTGRDKLAVCGDHGVHDWHMASYLNKGDASTATNITVAGVPPALKGSAHRFPYNDIEALSALLHQHRNQWAAVVMEPQPGEPPESVYLGQVQDLSRKMGVLLIFNETRSGFRMHCGGIHMLHAIEPDLAVFDRAMANGYAMAAVIGKGRIMHVAEKKGIVGPQQTERVGPAAALACLEKIIRRRVPDDLIGTGLYVKRIWQKMAKRHEVDASVRGLPSSPELHFFIKQNNSLFSKVMLAQGFLAAGPFYPSYAHDRKDLAKYETAADLAFAQLLPAKQPVEIHL